MQSLHQEVHAILTCYDKRLTPIVEIHRQQLILEGHEVLDPIRPVGGVHSMTRSACRSHFYDQLDGLVLVGHATHIHVFPHTNCQYGWLKVRDKVGETFNQDLAFQIRMLRLSCDGAEAHVAKQFQDKKVRILGRIILTQEKRVITLDEALGMLPDIDHPSHEHFTGVANNLGNTSHDVSHSVHRTGHGLMITS